MFLQSYVQNRIKHFYLARTILTISFRFPSFTMGPKKEASASAKKKDTPAAPATASAKKPAKAEGSAGAATKVVTKERKEKVKSTALKAKQRVAR